MEVLKKNDTKYIEDQPKIAELIGNRNYVCSMVPYLHALHVNTELIEAFGAYC